MKELDLNKIRHNTPSGDPRLGQCDNCNSDPHTTYKGDGTSTSSSISDNEPLFKYRGQWLCYACLEQKKREDATKNHEKDRNKLKDRWNNWELS